MVLDSSFDYSYSSNVELGDVEEIKKAAAIIDDWKICTGETFGQHRQMCDGCPDCVVPRRKRQQLLSENEEIAGVAMYKVVSIRAHQDYGINFYLNRSEIYDAHGEIDRDYYIFLQVKGFKDDPIREYFGIKSDDWNMFKNKYFPDWRGKGKDYLNIHMKDAIKHWTENHPKQVAIIARDKKVRHKINSNRI